MAKQTYKQANEIISFLQDQGPRKDDIMYNRLLEAAITVEKKISMLNYASQESIGYLKRYGIED